jgi:cellobiose phosphorylase
VETIVGFLAYHAGHCCLDNGGGIGELARRLREHVTPWATQLGFRVVPQRGLPPAEWEVVVTTTTNESSRQASPTGKPGYGAAAGTPPPQVALLSNGTYSVMLTDAGAGVSTWRGLDLSRWREDATRDCWGQFVYVRDLEDGRVWSIGRQPLVQPPDEYQVSFHAERAEFRRRDGAVETSWAACVARDFDAELRLVTLVNHGGRACTLDLTSYAEVCLNHRRADSGHPAFAKLFLETEFVADPGALLARRRPRAAEEKPVWALHFSAADASAGGAVEFETDRARFLGRGRTPERPAALDAGARLLGTTGPVLDPVFSLRRRIRIEPGGRARIAFGTGAADSRESAIALAERFRSLEAVEHAFAGARDGCRHELSEQGLGPEDVALFNRLAGAVYFTSSALREPEAIAANRLGQSGLWPHAISGDRPIVLVRVAADGDGPLVHHLVKWHAYARGRGLDLDLAILDERAGGSDRLKAEIQAGAAGPLLGKPGGVFVLDAGKVPADDAVLVAAAARAVLGGGRGTLADQLDGRPAAVSLPPPLAITLATTAEPVGTPPPPPEGLRFWNGHGGFAGDGREYVIVIDGSAPGGPALPPAPWTNVLANPGFGCLATEAGLGYSWAGNSQQNRLTPWSNDPVSDPPGEVIYLRDEETGVVWTPTPLPRGAGAAVIVRHGQGYTRYSRRSHGLEQELLVLVAPDDPIKLVCLRVRNDDDRPRRLSATFYAEWVLGGIRDNAPMQVVCEYDGESGAVLARSAWAGDFAGMLAFAAVGARPHSATADRGEFLGRHGSPAAPAALERAALSGSAGPLLDPCAALSTPIALAPGQAEEVVFVLGQADTLAKVRQLIASYTSPGRAREVLQEVQRLWDRILGAVQVTTPDAGMDLMINRWLPYQVLACRVWGRSAFYQSGGAFGFRDQLQDVMTLAYSAPDVARAQILRSAARQFEEGDVQHWWHPPAGRGVRTRITDDLYFLPLAVHHHVTVTGDTGLLDERVPFLKAPVLRPDQEDEYSLPGVTEEASTVYEHCVRALEHGYKLGAHGLPLMGTGDWNDGMNRVGAQGKGQSVWNGWFFITVLKTFAELADKRGDLARAAWCRVQAESLRVALEQHAWDGAWYRRAYFDDGTPLGSAQNDECQIDCLPQAWAVISGAADRARAEQAMVSVEERLVHCDARLIQLFDPPFDRGPLQPGYIKGYVPGIRENGGQYTHGATWVVLATALQGRGDRAVELWNLINPVYHAATPAEVEHYKVEPYVVCADIYGAPPHTGRGGWTWYTGSAGWLYRVALEAILGIRPSGEALRVEPCIPGHWPGFEVAYRRGSATYRIRVENRTSAGRDRRSVVVDGQPVPAGVVALRDDARDHDVRVMLGDATG